MDDNSFTGMKKGIAKVLSKGKSVYLHYEDIIRDTKAYQDCDIEEIPWKQTIGYISMAVSKESPMRKFLDMVILEMIDTGILQKSRLKWSIKKTDCKNEANATSIQKVIEQKVKSTFHMLLTNPIDVRNSFKLDLLCLTSFNMSNPQLINNNEHFHPPH